eukprot:g27388.t1
MLEWQRRRGQEAIAMSKGYTFGLFEDTVLIRQSVWSLHILPVSAWVSGGCSSFLPQSKDVQTLPGSKMAAPVLLQGEPEAEVARPGGGLRRSSRRLQMAAPWAAGDGNRLWRLRDFESITGGDSKLEPELQ